MYLSEVLLAYSLGLCITENDSRQVHSVFLGLSIKNTPVYVKITVFITFEKAAEVI